MIEDEVSRNDVRPEETHQFHPKIDSLELTLLLNNSRREKISVDQLKVMPWKNGLGQTTEIAAGGQNLENTGWSWRASIARVTEDCTFSIFSGVERFISVVDGAGMDFQFEDGKIISLEKNQTFQFDGGVPVECFLKGDQISDFNIMVNRRHHKASLRIIEGPTNVFREGSDQSIMLVHALDLGCTLTETNYPEQTIMANETMLYYGKLNLFCSLESNARAAVAVISDMQDVDAF